MELLSLGLCRNFLQPKFSLGDDVYAVQLMLVIYHPVAALLLIYLSFIACKKPGSSGSEPPFTSSPSSVPVLPGIVDEVSGIVDSYNNQGHLWIEQDSGNPPDLFLLRHDGKFVKTIHLKGAVNRDWEDMAIGNGPGTGQYLYIGDIGDNNAVYHLYNVYRLPEPKAIADTITVFDKLTFQYSDGPHDAEAFLVDNTTRDIYIITKRDALSVVYKINYPQSLTSTSTAFPVDTLPFSGAVSAAFSADQTELIIKTYGQLYYWKKKKSESFEAMIKQAPEILDHEREPQGEAICFRNDKSGFYTLSEKASSPSVSLKFYKRN